MSNWFTRYMLILHLSRLQNSMFVILIVFIWNSKKKQSFAFAASTKLFFFAMCSYNFLIFFKICNVFRLFTSWEAAQHNLVLILFTITIVCMYLHYEWLIYFHVCFYQYYHYLSNLKWLQHAGHISLYPVLWTYCQLRMPEFLSSATDLCVVE